MAILILFIRRYVKSYLNQKLLKWGDYMGVTLLSIIYNN